MKCENSKLLAFWDLRQPLKLESLDKQSETRVIMAQIPRMSRTDTKYNFIVYKAEQTETSSRSPTGNRTKNYTPSVSSRRSSECRRDNLDFDSVLAFGGTRRKTKKPKRSPQGLESIRDTNLSQTHRSGSVSSRSTSSEYSDASTLLDDQEGWQEWEAFRAKYEKRHKQDDRKAYGGRYGARRGYVEYRHRHDCDGLCQGICLGK